VLLKIKRIAIRNQFNKYLLHHHYITANLSRRFISWSIWSVYYSALSISKCQVNCI